MICQLCYCSGTYSEHKVKVEGWGGKSNAMTQNLYLPFVHFTKLVQQIYWVSKKIDNNNRLFMAPHLIRTQSTYKDIMICSFHHTHARVHASAHTHAHTHAHTQMSAPKPTLFSSPLLSGLCPDEIWRNAQPFVTTVGMVVHHLEVGCHAKEFGCYFFFLELQVR